jgi:hypothetical protein
MGLTSYEAWVFRRIMTGESVGDEREGLTESWRRVAERLSGCAPEERAPFMDGHLMGRSDGDAIFRALAAADPAGPPPAGDERGRPAWATLADVRPMFAEANWSWLGWLAGSALTALASDPGVGKTLLAMSLARAIWMGQPWPDGQPPAFPERTRTLWIPGDQHYHQLLKVASDYGMPHESILLNGRADSPTGGIDLDDDAILDSLRQQILAESPAVVIVDTVGMTTGCNLGRPEEARRYFRPLMTIAAETRTSFLMLTHLSKEAQALGRRIVGASRAVWMLTCPDPDGQPDRRKLWVDKSYALKPPALGMTIAEAGCTFDSTPPTEAAKDKGGRPSVKLGMCKLWLKGRLNPNPVPLKDLRIEAERAGFITSMLYRCREALGVEEYTVDRRKWWKLEDPASPSRDVQNLESPGE